MAITVSVLIFLTILSGAFAIQTSLNERKDYSEKRLRRLVKNTTPMELELVVHPAKSHLVEDLRKKLHAAGLHRQSDLKNAVFVQHLCHLVPVMIMLFLFLMGFPKIQILAAGVLTAVIFILIPRFWILRLIFKRRREIQRNLPDTLDLLILCLEAGLSFDSSLVRVAREQERISSHISRELKLTNQETLAGKPREEALRDLAERTGVEDVRTIVSAIQQSMKLGTSLVKTLRTQADVIRKKRRERIRAEIAKTPVKLIFPLLLFIFPTLIIVILGPSMVNIFRQLGTTGIPT